MPNPKTPWFQRAHNLLHDGPKPYEDVIAGTMYLVPPGLAWRRAEFERKRQAARRYGTWNHRVKKTTDAEIQLVGARRIVTDSLRSAIRDGRLVLTEVDGERVLSLRLAERPA